MMDELFASSTLSKTFRRLDNTLYEMELRVADQARKIDELQSECADLRAKELCRLQTTAGMTLSLLCGAPVPVDKLSTETASVLHSIRSLQTIEEVRQYLDRYLGACLSAADSSAPVN